MAAPSIIVERPKQAKRKIDPEAIEKRLKRRKLFRAREKIASDVNATIDQMMSLSTRGNDKASTRYHQRILSQMATQDYLLMTDYDIPKGSEWVMLKPDKGEASEWAKTIWPLKIGFVLHHADGAVSFDHYETVSPSLLRGRAKIVPQKTILHHSLTILENEWFAEETPLGLLSNQWIALDTGMTQERATGMGIGGTHCFGRISSKDIREKIHHRTQGAFSLALTARYYWHAAMATNGPRLLIPTSPKGCLDLFANRKKGEAERRRTALRHWVHNHYRDNESSGLTYVRDHLRGIIEFDWYDLQCELLVSEFDLEKNEFFKHEADQWRSQRKHNRVKVRLKDRRT